VTVSQFISDCKAAQPETVMSPSRGVSLNSVLSFVVLALLLGAATAPEFGPVTPAASSSLPEAQSIGKFLMPY
jgi:hypothetical protein